MTHTNRSGTSGTFLGTVPLEVDYLLMEIGLLCTLFPKLPGASGTTICTYLW